MNIFGEENTFLSITVDNSAGLCADDGLQKEGSQEILSGQMFGDDSSFLSLITGFDNDEVGNYSELAQSDFGGRLFGDESTFCSYVVASAEYVDSPNDGLDAQQLLSLYYKANELGRGAHFERCESYGDAEEARERREGSLGHCYVFDDDWRCNEFFVGKDCELDAIFEELNREFVRVGANSCGKIRVGNDYGAFEIDRKCGEPYPRVCPCPPERAHDKKCGCGERSASSERKQCKADSCLTDFADLFSWYWTAKDNRELYGDFGVPPCADGRFGDGNMRGDDGWRGGSCNPNSGRHSEQCPRKPCGKKLSRSIYYRLLQVSEMVSCLIECAPDERARQTLCSVKKNLNTISIAMLAVSKKICGSRPIVMNAFDGANCSFMRGVNEVICELSGILRDIQLLQTLPCAQCAYGALVVIAFGISRCQAMLFSLLNKNSC